MMATINYGPICFPTEYSVRNRSFNLHASIAWRLAWGMLDLYETFHEGGIYFQADLVTAYSCVVCTCKA
jgi:hypothetical protein